MIGRKALACSLSDIAAMGGIPYAALISIGLPKNAMKLFSPIMKGVSSLAKKEAR